MYNFIHIGKTAGKFITSFLSHNKISFIEYHVQKPKINHFKYIIWIRNPISRFVSAFTMVQSILNTEFKLGDTLTFYNCVSPCLISQYLKTGVAYTRDYDDLIRYFGTANNLAESLSSTDEITKQKALKLMNSTIEHIYRGIGWYLDNGEFIEKYKDQILFVGKMETMDDDINTLSKCLKIKNTFPSKKIRENQIDNNYKKLSNLAITNIIEFYRETDYKTLEILNKYNFIDNETLKSYYEYNLKIQI